MRSAVDAWSRNPHIYLGLYLLFFLWLFCLSGVVLNHPNWRVAGFWNERKQTSSELSISRPAETDELLAVIFLFPLSPVVNFRNTCTVDACPHMAQKMLDTYKDMSKHGIISVKTENLYKIWSMDQRVEQVYENLLVASGEQFPEID